MGLKLFSVSRNITDRICLEGTNPGWERYKAEVPHRYLIWSCPRADRLQSMCLVQRHFISPSSFLANPCTIHPLLLLMHRLKEHQKPKMKQNETPLLPHQLVCWRHLNNFLFWKVRSHIRNGEADLATWGSALTFRTALVGSQGRSLPCGGHPTNISPGKRRAPSLKVCPSVLYIVGLNTPLVQKHQCLCLHFPWKSFRLRHFNQFSGGTSSEGFA